jgi:hypothetical protein
MVLAVLGFGLAGCGKPAPELVLKQAKAPRFSWQLPGGAPYGPPPLCQLRQFPKTSDLVWHQQVSFLRISLQQPRRIGASRLRLQQTTSTT